MQSGKAFFSGRPIPRIIYNDDSCTLRCVPPPHTAGNLDRVVNYLVGTQVDCLCWCVWEGTAIAWPSEASGELTGQRYGGPNWHADTTAIYSLYRRGIDYLPLLIDRAHARDLTFVASVRMNDTHIKSHPGNVLAPDFWTTHQHLRLWDATDGKSYYNAGMDYSHAEVRQYYRDAIAKLARSYDIDGIEMDFTRSPYFFQPRQAQAKRDVLTGFVREVRDMLDRISRQRGRPMMLILRVSTREGTLRTAGIDLEHWITENLGHVLVITELFGNCNQSIEPWRSLCRKSGTLLYPVVKNSPALNNDVDFHSSLPGNPLAPRGGAGPATGEDEKIRFMRGHAQNLLAQQPDGLALFNFPCWLAEGPDLQPGIIYTDPHAFQRITALLSEIGSLDTLAGKDKRYAFYRDLPVYVEAGRPKQFHQTIPFTIRGHDLADATVTVTFRQIAEKNPHAEGNYRQNPIVRPGVLKYTLNDRDIPEASLNKRTVPAGRIPSGFKLRKHQIVTLTLPGSNLRDGKNTLAVGMPKFPEERDPYIYIYDLTVDVTFP